MPSDSAGLMNQDSVVAIQELYDVFAKYDVSDTRSIVELADILDARSTLLARDRDYRVRLGENTAPSLWPILHNLWAAVADAHAVPHPVTETQLATLCLMLAKFTRNLVAAVPRNQHRVFENEPAIRILLHHYTSFTVMQHVNSFMVSAILVQALSNFVTANEDLTQRLWTTYMALPEERSILNRLLGSPDTRTVLSVLVLVLNCIHDTPSRTTLLVNSSSGSRLCVSLLDRILSFSDAGDGSDEALAFDVGYRIFCHVFEGGMAPIIYNVLTIDGEVVVPHQVTLLKLLDAYLQNQSDTEHAILRGQPTIEQFELLQMLTACFFSFSTYVQHGIQRALASESSSSTDGASRAIPTTWDRFDGIDTPRVLDLLLPMACEALVLVSQCLISLALFTSVGHAASDAVSSGTTGTHESIRALTEYMNEAATSAGQGMPEALVATLRILDVFLPRITFGKAVPRPRAYGQNIRDIDAGSHVQESPSRAAQTHFSYLKRDLVRLLGILCADHRAVQDRVRMCEGIPVVMNLCVVDDQNPFLREHAIFTLRNLLYGNKANQAVVEEIKPIGKWDEEGVLRSVNDREQG